MAIGRGRGKNYAVKKFYDDFTMRVPQNDIKINLFPGDLYEEGQYQRTLQIL